MRMNINISLRRAIAHLAGDNLLVDLDRLIGIEGRIASGHFVNEDAQSPPIHCLVVTLEGEKLEGLQRKLV